MAYTIMPCPACGYVMDPTTDPAVYRCALCRREARIKYVTAGDTTAAEPQKGEIYDRVD